MKPFWVFAYDQYYPSGGMGDLKASYDTRKEAEERKKQLEGSYDYVDIIDIREVDND